MMNVFCAFTQLVSYRCISQVVLCLRTNITLCSWRMLGIGKCQFSAIIYLFIVKSSTAVEVKVK